MKRGAAEKIRKLIDRGLARYGRGDLKEAITEWERALALDAENGEAKTLIEFVRRKLDVEEDIDKRPTDPVLPTYKTDQDWVSDKDTDPEHHDDSATTREMPAVRAEPERPTSPRVKRPTLESPIPQFLAQITSPEWSERGPQSDSGEHTAVRDDAAPNVGVFDDSTRRLGSEPHGVVAGRVPPTSEARAEDSASGARVRASELVDRCRLDLGRRDVESAVTAAEAALREGELAPDPGISEVIEPARPLFEEAFEAYVGPVQGIPIYAMAPDVLAVQALDHRAGFLLSHIDGQITVEHLLDIAGMPRFEALRILCGLMRAKAIKVL